MSQNTDKLLDFLLHTAMQAGTDVKNPQTIQGIIQSVNRFRAATPKETDEQRMQTLRETLPGMTSVLAKHGYANPQVAQKIGQAVQHYEFGGETFDPNKYIDDSLGELDESKKVGAPTDSPNSDDTVSVLPEVSVSAPDQYNPDPLAQQTDREATETVSSANKPNIAETEQVAAQRMREQTPEAMAAAQKSQLAGQLGALGSNLFNPGANAEINQNIGNLSENQLKEQQVYGNKGLDNNVNVNTSGLNQAGKVLDNATGVNTLGSLQNGSFQSLAAQANALDVWKMQHPAPDPKKDPMAYNQWNQEFENQRYLIEHASKGQIDSTAQGKQATELLTGQTGRINTAISQQPDVLRIQREIDQINTVLNHVKEAAPNIPTDKWQAWVSGDDKVKSNLYPLGSKEQTTLAELQSAAQAYGVDLSHFTDINQAIDALKNKLPELKGNVSYISQQQGVGRKNGGEVSNEDLTKLPGYAAGGLIDKATQLAKITGKPITDFIGRHPYISAGLGGAGVLAEMGLNPAADLAEEALLANAGRAALPAIEENLGSLGARLGLGGSRAAATDLAGAPAAEKVGTKILTQSGEKAPNTIKISNGGKPPTIPPEPPGGGMPEGPGTPKVPPIGATMGDAVKSLGKTTITIGALEGAAHLLSPLAVGELSSKQDANDQLSPPVNTPVSDAPFLRTNYDPESTYDPKEAHVDNQTSVEARTVSPTDELNPAIKPGIADHADTVNSAKDKDNITAGHVNIFKKLSDADANYGGPRGVFPAIAKIESNMNPDAVNKNPNGTQDVGLMQINSSNFGNRLPQEVKDPDTNIAIATQLLQNAHKAFGNDTDRIAYSYNHGIGAAMRATPEQIANDDYVQKFRAAYQPQDNADSTQS